VNRQSVLVCLAVVEVNDLAAYPARIGFGSHIDL
jgi:hypothetical protein